LDAELYDIQKNDSRSVFLASTKNAPRKGKVDKDSVYKNPQMGGGLPINERRQRRKKRQSSTPTTIREKDRGGTAHTHSEKGKLGKGERRLQED